jgi:hypothetical protein
VLSLSAGFGKEAGEREKKRDALKVHPFWGILEDRRGIAPVLASVVLILPGRVGFQY